MKKAEKELRTEIVESCRKMNALGINQGTSGNISARFGDRMLISPSATPYEDMTPEMVASLPLEDASGAYEGPLRPSTEWRFHQKLLRGRPEAEVVIHAHSTYCTTLAIARKSIPACHYMIAAFGGVDVKCAGYATFGTEDLSVLALQAMEGRMACLLANHGMIVLGESMAKGMWRAVELETIAKQYYLSLAIGGPVLLSEADIDDTMQGFSSYGVQDKPARRAGGTAAAKKTASRGPTRRTSRAKAKAE